MVWNGLEHSILSYSYRTEDIYSTSEATVSIFQFLVFWLLFLQNIHNNLYPFSKTNKQKVLWEYVHK